MPILVKGAAKSFIKTKVLDTIKVDSSWMKNLILILLSYENICILATPDYL